MGGVRDVQEIPVEGHATGVQVGRMEGGVASAVVGGFDHDTLPCGIDSSALSSPDAQHSAVAPGGSADEQLNSIINDDELVTSPSVSRPISVGCHSADHILVARDAVSRGGIESAQVIVRRIGEGRSGEERRGWRPRAKRSGDEPCGSPIRSRQPASRQRHPRNGTRSAH